MHPLERERQIRDLGSAIEASDDSDHQRDLFAQMAVLIRARSPQTVQAMEAARGLLFAPVGPAEGSA